MLDVISSFLLAERATIISLAVTYWLSDLIEGYLFLHDGDSAVIRYMKGFRSDIEAGLVEFGVHIIVTLGGGLFLDFLIYPPVNYFLLPQGQLIIILSALSLFLSSIYEKRTDSHPWAIALPRIVGILLLLSSVYFTNPELFSNLSLGSEAPSGDLTNATNSSR